MRLWSTVAPCRHSVIGFVMRHWEVPVFAARAIRSKRTIRYKYKDITTTGPITGPEDLLARLHHHHHTITTITTPGPGARRQRHLLTSYRAAQGSRAVVSMGMEAPGARADLEDITEVLAVLEDTTEVLAVLEDTTAVLADLEDTTAVLAAPAAPEGMEEDPVGRADRDITATLPTTPTTTRPSIQSARHADTISGLNLAMVFCILVALASVRLIRFVRRRRRRRSSSSSNATTQERPPVKKIRRHPYWTYQRLRNHLDDQYGGRILWSRRSA
ncbi:hypothetical protein LA080_004516 [Diaporthe eres]|nr:hypothetical protein LA080_004516 [Diaporthe eres]